MVGTADIHFWSDQLAWLRPGSPTCSYDETPAPYNTRLDCSSPEVRFPTAELTVDIDDNGADAYYEQP